MKNSFAFLFDGLLLLFTLGILFLTISAIIIAVSVAISIGDALGGAASIVVGLGG